MSVELLGLYWTVSGPVEVHVGREWSLFDWADRCAEARKVGFSGLGIWHADLQHVLETQSLREMKEVFDDNGLRYLELEFLMDWFLDEDDERREASDEIRELLFDAAGALDAHHIKVGNIPGTPCGIPQLTERFGELCADAAQHTDAKIVYEFMPFDVNVHDLDTALAVVEGAARRQRRPRHRHLAHVEARNRADRSAPHPARVPVVGRAERRPARRHGRPDRRDGQPPRAARRGRVRRARLRRGVSGARLRRARGESRCSPTSCATIRST